MFQISVHSHLRIVTFPCVMNSHTLAIFFSLRTVWIRGCTVPVDGSEGHTLVGSTYKGGWGSGSLEVYSHNCIEIKGRREKAT